MGDHFGPHPLQLLFPDKAEGGARFATSLLFATKNQRIDSVQWFDGGGESPPPYF